MSTPPNRTIPGPPYCPICITAPDTRTEPLFDADIKFAPLGNGRLYINSECHPYAGLLAEFCNRHHNLTLVCRMCSRVAGYFQITTKATFSTKEF